MTRIPIDPHHIRCVDGRWISILTPPRRWERHADEDDYTQEPPVRLRAVPEDPAVEASGMSRYWHSHNRREGDDAEYAQVPVGIVRAFIRLHGGIDEIGPDALAELQRAAALEQAGDPPKPAPAAEAPATDSPARTSRTRELMAAGTHDFLGRPLTAAQLALDYLTPAVIEARRGLSEVEGPLVLGLGHAEASPRRAALERRAEVACLTGSRLSLVDHPRYSAHPLRNEAIALQKRLSEAREKAEAELAREA
ncbi:MAG: hypothetical protein INR70_05050 [Parafilimonas terrae]|nr:hypothetical protein [Parafilimonas terrae]